MKVRIVLSEKAMQENRLDKNEVWSIVTCAFEKRGLKNRSTEEQIIIEDRGGEDDYSFIWLVIHQLLEADWFVNCATSLVYEDDGIYENVLEQLAQLRKL